MIFKELIKPSPPNLIDQAVDKVRTFWSRESRETLGWKPNEYSWNQGKKYLLKPVYTAWLETEVRPKFPVGSLATMKGLAYIPNRAPVPVFEVADLIEVTWMAEVDPHFHQPKCVVVRVKDKGQFGHTMYAPNQIRPLTPEEINIVHARDTSNEVLSETPRVVVDPDGADDADKYAG